MALCGTGISNIVTARSPFGSDLAVGGPYARPGGLVLGLLVPESQVSPSATDTAVAHPSHAERFGKAGVQLVLAMAYWRTAGRSHEQNSKVRRSKVMAAHACSALMHLVRIYSCVMMKISISILMPRISASGYAG